MTQYLEEMKIGESIDVRGPKVSYNCSLAHFNLLCHILGHYVTSWDIMSHHGTLSHIMGHYVTSWHIMSHLEKIWHIMGHIKS